MSGAAYVPIEPRDPPSRVRELLETCGSRVLVHPDDHAPPSLPGVKCLSWQYGETQDAGEASRVKSDSDDLAHVLFTSGSTGQPKGVAVPHRAVLRLLAPASFAPLGPTTRWLAIAPMGFDASTLEVFAPLLNGGTCVQFPRGERLDAETLGAVVDKERVTHAWITASLFNALVDQSARIFRPFEHLLIGGERVSVTHARRMLAACPSTRLVNGYGPTENTVFTTCYDIPSPLPDTVTDLPIGTPVAGTDVRVVDDAFEPVADGEPGELLALGDGLALGYIGDPARTAEKFIDWTVDGGASLRAYRTGDRVRRRADGQLEFLGRMDDQVKIEGHRIEPGEVEAALATTPGVDQCRVVARANPGGEMRLIAYVVGHADGLQQAIRDRATAVLPRFMQPHFIVVLDALPITANGKLDARSLPDPMTAHSAPDPAPAGEVSMHVEAAWSAVLGYVPGRDVNLFDAGGTSLDATRLLFHLQSSAVLDLPSTFVFEHPSISSQVAALTGQGDMSSQSGRGQRRRAAAAGRRGRGQ